MDDRGSENFHKSRTDQNDHKTIKGTDGKVAVHEYRDGGKKTFENRK